MRTPWTIRYDRLRTLWPGVGPGEVCSVLAHVDAAGGTDRIDDALALSGVEAASALMAPVASVFGSVDRADRALVLHALDALIRAGGDPSPALRTLAQGLGDSRTVQQACAGLHRAALFGHSLESVRDDLSKVSANSHVKAVQRLEALQRSGKHAELRRLRVIYEQQRPIGNLHGGIGLVEELLLSAIEAEAAAANLALAELESAGADFYRCWVALLPILNAQLRAPDRERRQRAVAALGQLRFAVARSPELEEREALHRLLPLLSQALDGLTALLQNEDAESAAAAKVIEEFVASGASLANVRGRLEAALAHERVEVRSACSRALSIELQRSGKEAPLPRGRSHRRTFATAETALEEGRKACPNCKAMTATVIYESRDRGNTWDETTIELRCSSCRIYSVEQFGL